MLPGSLSRLRLPGAEAVRSTADRLRNQLHRLLGVVRTQAYERFPLALPPASIAPLVLEEHPVRSGESLTIVGRHLTGVRHEELTLVGHRPSIDRFRLS